MNNQGGNSGSVSIPWLWILAFIGFMWFMNDGITGVTVGRNTMATNGMASQVSTLNQTVQGGQTDILTELSNLANGQSAIVQTLGQQNQAITQQGDLLTGLFDAVGGLTTSVTGINQRLDIYDGRLMQLETAAQNGGLFSANNQAPTPVPVVTQ